MEEAIQEKPVENNIPVEAEEIKPDKDGKYPETVKWEQYVRTKETIGNKLNKANDKIKDLESQLTKLVKPEDHQKIVDELNQLKASNQKITDDLNKAKESELSNKRNELVSRGIPEDEVKAMSELDLNNALKLVGYIKPKLDLGNGGGSGSLKGSPLELARLGYESSNRKK